MTVIEVISPGPLTTIQDLGRPGWAHIGVPRSGAADRESLVQANRLVGNRPGSPALETTLAGPKLRADTDTVIALTGARVNATAGERQVPMDLAVELGASEILTIGNALHGLRTYIAFAGGVDAARTLGSASADLLTGLGPPRLARGDRLTLQVPDQLPGHSVVVGSEDPDTGAGRTSTAPADRPTLRVVLGPRQDWFTADAITALTSEPFVVSAASNRIGVRLNGPDLERAVAGELLSEGLVTGALQVTSGGQPILLLADHPTTGGYPVIAVVIDSDLALAAQLRPGQSLQFSLAG